jgi:RNA polymerase sigma-70 factor (ECF subfamily)
VKAGTITLDSEARPQIAESLDDFFKQVQQRALGMARLATGSTDDALDLVQDAMCAFVRAYRNKPAEDRKPLFYRCLDNRILDWHRKRQRHGRWMLPWGSGAEQHVDGPDAGAVAAPALRPDNVQADADFARALDQALQALPTRQRQVFLLRAWEGLDVAETATALRISGGSVKTHYFRAMNALRQALEAFDE